MISLLLGLGCSNDDGGITVFNSPPSAQILSHSDGDIVLENYTVELRGTASDPDHDSETLRVSWQTQDGELCPEGPPSTEGITICETKLTQENQKVFLYVFDPENESDSAQVELNVIPSGPPDGIIVSPVNNATTKYYSNVLISFEAIVEDAEADPEDLLVSWNSDLDGDLVLGDQPDAEGNYIDTSYLTEGDHRITMTVLDPEGNEATQSVDIEVGGENQPPSCNITEPVDGTAIGYGEQIILRGTASDPDVTSNMLTAVWSSNIDGELNTTTPTAEGEFLYGTSALSGGVHTITLTVTDEAGANCSDFVLLTVSVPPDITILEPTLNDIFNNEENISFVASVSDLEDNAALLSVSWSSDVDGEFASLNADSTGQALINYNGLSPGNHVITATVTDTGGLSSSALVAIEVTDCDTTYWYLDADNDTYGNPNTLFPGCNPPSGYISQSGDCDDSDPSQYPGADEYCNTEDDNCDGIIDEPTAVDVNLWYADSDGDGYGDPSTMSISCDPPSTVGYVTEPGDCDDTSISVNPDAIEVCEDGIDNDCVDGDLSCQITVDLANADTKLYGNFDYDHAGFAVSSAGDVNGDGLDDFMVGAYGNDISGNAAGIVYVMTAPVNTGTVNLSTAATATIYGENTRDYAGYDIAPAGDMNGDNLADVLVSAYGENTGDVDAGATYLLLAPFSGDIDLIDAQAKFTGIDFEEYSGNAIAGNGDFNGDGTPDIAIGAYADDTSANDAGAVYLVHGSSALSGTYSLSTADAKFLGENGGDFAGYDVAFVGDTDGDGFDDLLIGAYGEDTNGNAAGVSYLVNGNQTGIMNLQLSNAIIRGEGSFHFAGQAVSSAGDFNNDGYPDLLIGSSGEDTNGNNTGAAYVLFSPVSGFQTLANAEVKFTGEASLHYAGRSVSSAGDTNADGYDDLIIGAPGETTGGTAAGAAYIVLGPETGTVSIENTYAKAFGEADGDNTGWSVSAIGDIDGDGKTDLITGAYKESSFGFEVGAAYILLGNNW